MWLKSWKKHNRLYSDPDIVISEERLHQISVDEYGYIQSLLQIRDE